MGYSGPGYGILSLVVSEKYIWCLDYKGGLFCSALPGAGLRWQKFEDAVQQVAVSPSGSPPHSLLLLPVSAPRSCSPPPGADILAQGSPAAALGSGCGAFTRFASSGTFEGVFSKERELLHWMSIHSVNGVQFEFLFSLLIAMVTPDHIFVS